jgi:hypothetical protein
MKTKSVLILTACVLQAWACGTGIDEGAPIDDVETSEQALTVPAGWTSSLNRVGVRCWSSGQQRVCAADLRTARAGSVHGTLSGPAGERTYDKQPLETLWNSAAGAAPAGMTRALAVNASFFDPNANPTGSAFPYKRNGTLLSYGYESGGHTAYLRNLHIWWDRQYADIGTHSNSAAGRAALQSFGSAPDIVGGLDRTDPALNLRCNSPTTARTFVGVHDANGDGQHETLMFFSGPATCAAAHAVLVSFGAVRTMMLDGGASTGLRTSAGPALQPTTRPIPNALVVYAP